MDDDDEFKAFIKLIPNTMLKTIEEDTQLQRFLQSIKDGTPYIIHVGKGPPGFFKSKS